MRQTATTIRLDADLKAEFDKLCEEFGMSANTAFNIYVKTVVRQRRIPFQIETAEHNNLNTKGWEAILQLGKQAEKAGLGGAARRFRNERGHLSRDIPCLYLSDRI